MNEFLVSGLRKLVEKTADDFDPAALTPLMATRAIEEWARIEKIACAQKLRAAQRAEDGGLDAEAAVANSSGVSTGKARRQTRAARKTKGKTKDAFDKGKLSPEQAEAIAEAAAANPDAEDSLLELAERSSVSDLFDECERVKRAASDDASTAARQRDARFLRFWKDAMGMVRGSFALEPLLGAKLMAEIERRSDRFFRAQSKAGGPIDSVEHRMADALTGMLDELGGSGDGKRRGPRTVVRLVATKAAVERGYVLPGEKCETAEGDQIPMAALDEALKDRDTLVQEVTDALKIITYKKYIPKRTRDALESMGVRCVVPGCGRTKHLQIDHTVERRDGGPTTLTNLAFLCPYHHRLKSARLYDLWHDENGWHWEPRRARAPDAEAG